MSENSKQVCKSTHPPAVGGMIWFIGWLFTIGFTGLPFWKALLGLIIWPFFLGAALK